MARPVTPIRKWLDENEMSLTDFRNAIGRANPVARVSVAQVSRLVSGKQWPTRIFVRACFKVTGGAIDANSWAGVGK